MEDTEYHIAKNRLETLIDGIFAIAMTLLVLGITAPKPPVDQAPAVLSGEVFDLFPQVLIFVIAFLVLAVFWLNHHRQFHFVRSVDPRLLWLNIALLIFIVLIPFSTDIAGDYPDVPIAVLVFHLNILAVGLVFVFHWRYICRAGHLCERRPDERAMRARTIDTNLIPVVAAVAIGISFFSCPVSLLAYLVVPAVVIFMSRKHLI
jgi:uncharacterized membrane protein